MSEVQMLSEQENGRSGASRDSRSLAVERVIGSTSFAKSKRMQAFLIYISRCALENRTDEVTEQQIGIHVFGRDPGYNPAEDNIVRTTARQLRQRLAVYYQEEGAADPIRIRVPRGGYIPSFEELGAQNPPALASAAAEPEFPTLPRADRQERLLDLHNGARPRNRSRLGFAAALLLGAGLALLLQHMVSGSSLYFFGSPSGLLWRQLFSPTRTTLFVPGDAGLNLYNVFSGRAQQLSLHDYASGNYQFPAIENLTTKLTYQPRTPVYVSLTDMRLADDITTTRYFRRDHYEIRFPRDLSPNDLHDANAIICGAPPYNPWVELFDDRLNFHFLYSSETQTMKVINRHPISGEPAVYESATTPSRVIGWGYVALTSSLDGAGRVLLIEGTSQAGVEAAIAFLFDDQAIAPILARARRSGHPLSNFEVLLQASLIKDSSGKPAVVATRFYPQ